MSNQKLKQKKVESRLVQLSPRRKKKKKKFSKKNSKSNKECIFSRKKKSKFKSTQRLQERFRLNSRIQIMRVFVITISNSCMYIQEPSIRLGTKSILNELVRKNLFCFVFQSGKVVFL